MTLLSLLPFASTARRLTRPKLNRRYLTRHTRPVTDELDYRVTITLSRYGGIYEPGLWIAFATDPDNLPPEWNADDVTCRQFYIERRAEVGGGDTPQAAFDDLVRLCANVAASRSRSRTRAAACPDVRTDSPHRS